MTDEQFLLASAYFDNELDAADRARAEADTEVMREVDALRALRADLRDVAPASQATRTTAIAAALQAWSPSITTGIDADTTPTVSSFDPPHPSIIAKVPGSTPTPPPPARPRLVSVNDPATSPPQGSSTHSSSSHSSSSQSASSTSASSHPTASRSGRSQASTSSSRSSSKSQWVTPSRLLGAAAAIVGIGVAGMVVLNTVGGSDGAGAAIESSFESDSARSTMAAPSATVTEEDSVAYDVGAAVESEIDSATPSTAPLAESAVDTAVVPTLVPVIPIPTLELTPAELKVLAEDLLADRPNASDGSDDVVVYDCSLPTPESATLIGHSTVKNNDTTRPTVTLLIVADEARDNAYAIDPETCFVVQTARLYP